MNGGLWVELSGLPGGCARVSNLLSGTVWFLSLKILLLWLLEEVTPFGPKGRQMLPVWRSDIIKTPPCHPTLSLQPLLSVLNSLIEAREAELPRVPPDPCHGL